MYCSLDWLTRRIALARTHPVGGLGDPWTWSCVVQRQGDTAVILLAQTSRRIRKPVRFCEPLKSRA